ncbi:NAC domain-containing protein [Canna indica]|uniref:NAC domain-containing protein n=1 Tax=Canna indica TaxID=4628 RepID=A0AAQ3JPH0_9LILI|nr:NAC domain-containing protein [Canna indica]
MCPSVPESGRLGINIRSSDEELIRFLEGRRAGDPTPDNVITGVDPFSVEPWDSPENFWYLNKSASSGPEGECQIKVTKSKSGYWRRRDDAMIPMSTWGAGRKRTLEFYHGKAPFGERTGWMMLEYQAEVHTLHGCDHSKDNSSLCRIFQQNNGRALQGEQNYFAGPRDSDGEYVERVLLCLLEHEQRDLSSRNSAKSFQTVDEKGEGKSASSGRRLDEPVHEASVENMFEIYDLSNGEYLELNDIYSPETPASSDISSFMSVNSDEFFDPNEFLGVIESDHEVGVRQTNCKFSVCAPVKSSQVIISPPLPGSINGNGDLAIKDNNSASLVLKNEHASHLGDPSSSDGLWTNGKTSTASRPHGSKASQTSNILHRRGTLKGSGSNSVRNIAKIGKKYCCFVSF